MTMDIHEESSVLKSKGSRWWEFLLSSSMTYPGLGQLKESRPVNLIAQKMKKRQLI